MRLRRLFRNRIKVRPLSQHGHPVPRPRRRMKIVPSSMHDNPMIKQDDRVRPLPIDFDLGFLGPVDMIVEEPQNAFGFFFTETDNVLGERFVDVKAGATGNRVRANDRVLGGEGQVFFAFFEVDGEGILVVLAVWGQGRLTGLRVGDFDACGAGRKGENKVRID